MSAVYRNPDPPSIQWMSDGFFDFWASRINPLWTRRRSLARLVARSTASTDAVTLELQPNRHFPGLKPGQHVSLGMEIDGRLTCRSYSPTVLANGRLAITVKRVDGGKVSNHLAEAARIGDVFDLGPAFGEMTLEPMRCGRVLMLAAGSGITPMRALLTQLAAAGMPVQVDLVYWAQRQAELCFAEELATLAARHPNFTLHLALTREGEVPAVRVGDYDLAALGELGETRVMACGSSGFVEAARARLTPLVASFEGEAFSVPVLPSVEEGSVQVELLRSGRTLTVPRGTSLLLALEAEGLKPASGCRMGICNTCVCGKASGVTRHTLTGEYAAEPSVPLKLCVSSASTDLTLEL